MKIFKGLFIGLGIVSAAMAGTPIETLIPIKHVYSPKGFDSNDNSQVIVEGFLPNLCHKSPMTSVKVSGNKIEITVKALKYDPSNPFCPEVIVPFVEAVNVGVLDKGLYDITVNSKSVYEKESQLRIDEASSSSVDEFVYANVAYIEKQSGNRIVNLKGYNPSDCFVLDEIQIVDNGSDAYSILPKMKQVDDFCPMKMVPFQYEVEVPRKLQSEKVLLHVRAMDGKSVNTIFYNNQRR